MLVRLGVRPHPRSFPFPEGILNIREVELSMTDESFRGRQHLPVRTDDLGFSLWKGKVCLDILHLIPDCIRGKIHVSL